MSKFEFVDGLRNQTEQILEDIITDFKARMKYANLYAFIELRKRGRPITTQSLAKLEEFAIESGSSSWESYFNDFQISHSEELNEFAIRHGINDWETYKNRFKMNFDNLNMPSSNSSGNFSEIYSSDPLIKNPNDSFYKPLISGNRYPALRTLSGVMTIVAWTVAVITLIIVLTTLSELKGEGSWIAPLAILVIGGIFFIGLLAYAEIIKVFVDIEANTRKTPKK